MDANEYSLRIDEVEQKVYFNTSTMSGARAGLADLKRQRKLVALRRRERLAQLRLDRSQYTGTREISRWGRRGGWIVQMFQSFARFSAYTKTAVTDAEIAKIDRVLIAIDRAIIELEETIQKNSD